MEKNDSFQPTGKRLDNLNREIKSNHPKDLWVMKSILNPFLSIINSSSTLSQQRIVVRELNQLFNAYEFRYNTILENNIMKNEFRRMQELAGVPVTSTKINLKENFVGMGAINNPFAKSKKTDYELAFERYSNTLNEEKPSLEMFKNIKEEEGENPVDTIMMDVPLFIRMLEYAREDASTDMDLHDVAEKAVTLSAQGEPLNMDSYNDLIGQEEEIMENIVTENSYSAEGYSIFNSEYDDSIGIAHDSAEDTMVVLSLDPNVDFGETAVDNGTIKLGNKLVYWAVTTG